MSRERDAVLAAIDRWLRSSLVDDDLAARLRADVVRETEAAASRTAQVVLSITGGIVLIIAGGVFLNWAWPLLEDGARTAVLVAAGIAVTAAGVLVDAPGRVRAVSWGLQLAGLGLLFSAYVYSERVWPDQSAAGTIFGLTALVVPIVLAPRAMRRDRVMPAVHLVASLGFLAVFLDRSTPFDPDTIVWILDAVLVGGVVTLGAMVRRDPLGEEYPWVFNAFVAAMGAGFVLVWLTALEPLSLGDEAAFAVDVWWGISYGLTLWGLDRLGSTDMRAGLSRLLSLEVLGWIPLGLWTGHEAMDGDWPLATLLVSGLAVATFLFADRRRLNEVLPATAFAFVVPIWGWAIDEAGALGGIAALIGTAVLLFRAAARRESAGEP